MNQFLKVKDFRDTILVELIGGANIKETLKQAADLMKEKNKDVIFFHSGLGATIIVTSGDITKGADYD